MRPAAGSARARAAPHRPRGGWKRSPHRDFASRGAREEPRTQADGSGPPIGHFASRGSVIRKGEEASRCRTGAETCQLTAANRQVSPAGIGDGWAGLRARAPPAVRGQVRAHRFSAASVSTAPPKPARWAVLAHGGDRGSEESCTPPSHGRQQGCAVSIHPRLVTSVPHLVWSRPLAGRPISEESPGVMPRPAHGLHETGPIYSKRQAGRLFCRSAARSSSATAPTPGTLTWASGVESGDRHRRPVRLLSLPRPTRHAAHRARPGHPPLACRPGAPPGVGARTNVPRERERHGRQ